MMCGTAETALGFPTKSAVILVNPAVQSTTVGAWKCAPYPRMKSATNTPLITTSNCSLFNATNLGSFTICLAVSIILIIITGSVFRMFGGFSRNSLVILLV
uniref:(northern house mosquito) hypothetical protein n=1 Tax=Culex pipiens TaxID=7175 RepID=A0A8D8E3Q2_CULPI